MPHVGRNGFHGARGRSGLGLLLALTWAQALAWFTSVDHVFDGGREPRPVVGQPCGSFSLLDARMRSMQQAQDFLSLPCWCVYSVTVKDSEVVCSECQMVFNCLAGCSGGRLIRSIRLTTQSRISWYATSVTAACRRSSRRGSDCRRVVTAEVNATSSSRSPSSSDGPKTGARESLSAITFSMPLMNSTLD